MTMHTAHATDLITPSLAMEARQAGLEASLTAEAAYVGRAVGHALRGAASLDDAAASAALAATRDAAGADALDRAWSGVCHKAGWGEDVYWRGWPYVVDAYYDRCAE
jgi:hypothetical protein